MQVLHTQSSLRADRGNLPHRQAQKLDVECARPFAVTTLRAYLTAMHSWFLEDIDDDLDAVLGLQSSLLTLEEAQKLVPRIRNHLSQLINIALQRAEGNPCPELNEALNRAHRLDTEPVPTDFPSTRGHVRRLALTAQDVLEVLETGTRDAPAAASVDGRWSV